MRGAGGVATDHQEDAGEDDGGAGVAGGAQALVPHQEGGERGDDGLYGGHGGGAGSLHAPQAGACAGRLM